MEYKDLYDIKIGELAQDRKSSGLTRAINIFEEMGISNVGQLLDYAYENGIVEDPDAVDRLGRKVCKIDFKIQGIGRYSNADILNAIKSIHCGIVIGKSAQENDESMKKYDNDMLRKKFLGIDLIDLDIPHIKIHKTTSPINERRYYGASIPTIVIKTLGDLLHALADSDISEQIPDEYKEKLFKLGLPNIQEGMTRERINNIYVSSEIIELAKAIVVRETKKKHERYDEEARAKAEKIHNKFGSLDSIKRENEEIQKEVAEREVKIAELQSLLKEREELISGLREKNEQLDSLWREYNAKRKNYLF